MASKYLYEKSVKNALERSDGYIRRLSAEARSAGGEMRQAICTRALLRLQAIEGAHDDNWLTYKPGWME
jgi:hypothetical protein